MTSRSIGWFSGLMLDAVREAVARAKTGKTIILIHQTERGIHVGKEPPVLDMCNRSAYRIPLAAVYSDGRVEYEAQS